jgi:hypothetical protein
MAADATGNPARRHKWMALRPAQRSNFHEAVIFYAEAAAEH